MTFPRDEAVVVGCSVTLKCQTDTNLPINWHFTSFDSDKTSEIYINKELSVDAESSYSISTNSTGIYDLVVKSVNRSLAGTYTCSEVQVESKQNASAELTVLDSDPECKTSVMENDYLQMWCRLNFTGNLVPNMTWTRRDGKPISSDTTITNNAIESSFTPILTIHPDSVDNGVAFSCKTRFSSQNPSGSNDLYSSYVFEWTYISTQDSSPNVFALTFGIAATGAMITIIAVKIKNKFTSRRSNRSQNANFEEPKAQLQTYEIIDDQVICSLHEQEDVHSVNVGDANLPTGVIRGELRQPESASFQDVGDEENNFERMELGDPYTQLVERPYAAAQLHQYTALQDSMPVSNTDPGMPDYVNMVIC